MTGYSAVKDSLILQANNGIVSKEAPDSIDPSDVGGVDIAIVSALEPFIDKINNFFVYHGTAIPSSSLGAEGDYYYRTNGGVSIVVYRKDATDWSEQSTIPLGISYQDGIITGLRTQIYIADEYVNVSSGTWAINNSIYSKAIPTVISYNAPEVGSDRIDTIYANTSGQVLYLAGAPSGSPVKPTLPANTIEIDSIYVPADGTGNAYLFSAGSDVDPQEIDFLPFDQSDLVSHMGAYRLAYSGEKRPLYVESNGVSLSFFYDGSYIYGFIDNSTQTIKIKVA